jgi:aminoglycoside 6'-N-acetyltransferase I
MQIRKLRPEEHGAWLELRELLWPDFSREELTREQQEIIADSERNCVLVAALHGTQPAALSGGVRPGGALIGGVRPADELIGFVEVSIRDWAEGCATRPVGYIEAWYVNPDHRRSGIGRRLIEAAEQWTLSRGCTEIGSDAELHNEVSHSAHRALGFVEGIRVVQFSKKIEC